IPADSRAAAGKSLPANFVSDDVVARVRSLGEIAKRRGQSLAQMAIAWALRGNRVTTALIGASRPEQVVDSVGALGRRDFAPADLAAIDRYAVDSTINIWAASAKRPGTVRP
ncbi:aldo/keto reductase, partial [Mycobacterium tuberculosis]|nr:aldo/keto reductase [Mycobacterium tuberculosis]